MPFKAVIYAVAGVALAVATADFAAASCVIGLSNEEHLKSSTAVFIGRAVSQRIDRYAETTFQVEQSWKGALEKQVRVSSCSSQGAIVCGDGFDFAIGERYLVFAFSAPFRTSAPFSTSGCSLTRLAAEAGELVAWLDAQKIARLPNTRVEPAATTIVVAFAHPAAAAHARGR